ncbi:MAG: HEAT repeat domain-containing protein, partial [Chloroflexi bacterium]|nr:HEAT repeat domain-containing protein [Chloroflexota bacterium]
ELLIIALKDGGKDVQTAAVAALGQIGDARAIEPLITALKNLDKNVRRAAADALAQIDWQPTNNIQRAFYLAARQDWAEAIRIGADIELLIIALKDGGKDVQTAAVAALGQIGDARAIEPLLPLLKDKDSDLRKAAAEALGMIGWQPTENIQHAFYLAAQQDWAEALRIGADIDEFVEVYPHQVIRHIFKSALPKSAKLEIVLNKFGLASAVRENWIFCECGLPVQSRYRDNSIGVMYKFCSVETDKEDYYTNIYSCANCGRYVRSITS